MPHLTGGRGRPNVRAPSPEGHWREAHRATRGGRRLQAGVAASRVRIRREPEALVVPASVAHAAHASRVRAMPRRACGLFSPCNARAAASFPDWRVHRLVLDGVLEVELLLTLPRARARRRVASSGSRSAFSTTGDMAGGCRAARFPCNRLRLSRLLRIRSMEALATSRVAGRVSSAHAPRDGAGSAWGGAACPLGPVPPSYAYGRKGVPLLVVQSYVGFHDAARHPSRWRGSSSTTPSCSSTGSGSRSTRVEPPRRSHLQVIPYYRKTGRLERRSRRNGRPTSRP